VVEKIRKDYYCPACKKKHQISFPAGFASDKASYPFAHVFLHKLEGATDIEETAADVLTTLYVDANCDIRGVDAKQLVAMQDVMAVDDFTHIVSQLMDEIARLLDDYHRLQAEYKALQARLDDQQADP
jgi:hypothetical protein